MEDIGNGEGEKTGHLYKVLVIGDYAVGKTSLIRRYTEGFFTPNYKLTIGVFFFFFFLFEMFAHVSLG